MNEPTYIAIMTISDTSTAARENARRPSGEFGTHEHRDPEVSLAPPIPDDVAAAVRALRADAIPYNGNRVSFRANNREVFIETDEIGGGKSVYVVGVAGDPHSTVTETTIGSARATITSLLAEGPLESYTTNPAIAAAITAAEDRWREADTALNNAHGRAIAERLLSTYPNADRLTLLTRDNEALGFYGMQILDADGTLIAETDDLADDELDEHLSSFRQDLVFDELDWFVTGERDAVILLRKAASLPVPGLN